LSDQGHLRLPFHALVYRFQQVPARIELTEEAYEESQQILKGMIHALILSVELIMVWFKAFLPEPRS
jgi:hypothetical protein